MTASIEPDHLSQRELRNESGRVLREVGAGASFIVTNAGVPVGRLVPLDDVTQGLRIDRPARRVGGWRVLDIPRKRTEVSLTDTLDAMREERV